MFRPFFNISKNSAPALKQLNRSVNINRTPTLRTISSSTPIAAQPLPAKEDPHHLLSRQHSVFDTSMKSISVEDFAALSPVDRIRAVYHLHGDKAVQLASMQRTSGVLMHLIHRAQVPIPILFIDTGYLHEDTIALRDEFANKYGLNITTLTPELTPEETKEAAEKELYMSREGQVKCCYLRKEKPLHKYLDNAHVEAKLSGMMQAQGGARADIAAVQEEDKDGKVTLYNPLFDWNNKMIHEYNAKYDVPVHNLYSKSYKSIGCKPCTTPVKPGEDARAGRWRHLREEGDQTHVYCGLNKTDISPARALAQAQAKARKLAKKQAGKEPKKVKLGYLAKKKAAKEAGATH